MNSVKQPVIADEKWSWSEKLGDLEPNCLGRGKYAKFLTGYLRDFDDRGYVMNLNAEWGAGKTYFLKRWQETIKDTYPTAYIDAWRNDFDDDPLLTVIAGITDALQQYPNARAYKYRQDMAKSAGHFLKKMAPTILKGLAKTYVGFDENEYKDWDVKLSNFDDAAEKLLENSLSEHKKKSIELDKFKNTIGKWLAEAKGSNANGTPHLPMFVFIDELDRCRPTYAIEMLEVIKHLFEITGLVFVIATNTDQLQHSIKAVYGGGFDANTYLRRFFKRTFILGEPTVIDYINNQEVFLKLKDCLLGNFLTFDAENLDKTLSSIANTFLFDLRTTAQWLDQFYACLVQENIMKLFWPCLAYLMAMRIYSRECYEEFIREGIEKEIGELQNFRNSNKRIGRTSVEIFFSNRGSNFQLVLSSDSIINILRSGMNSSKKDLENKSENLPKWFPMERRMENEFILKNAMFDIALRNETTKFSYNQLIELGTNLS